MPEVVADGERRAHGADREASDEPVLTVRDELEVPARQRVKPVRHAHTSVPVIWIRCC
jgi:hypothetical protein